MVRLGRDLEATILLPLLRLASHSPSPLICLICGTIIPCDIDCHLDCNPFINFNNAPFLGLLQQEPFLIYPLLQVAETAREPTTLKKQYSYSRPRLLQQHNKVVSHDRVIVTDPAKVRRQHRSGATTKANPYCRAQALNRRHLISTTGPSPLQNSSLPNRPGRRASLDPVQRVTPANQHLLLVLHHRPHQAHLQKPHAQPQRSILLQLYKRQERDREPEPELTGPFLVPITLKPRPKGIEAVSTATGLFQRLHTLHQRTTIDQLNSPP